MANKIEHIQENDFLNTGRQKINEFAIDPALRAEGNSIEAKDTANQANETSTEVKDRLDNIVAGEMDDAEVIDARKPYQEEAFQTLKERLDTQIGKTKEFREWETSLTEKTKNEFTERGINSKWFDISSKEKIQSMFDLAISEKRNVLISSGEYDVPISLVNAEEIEIDFGNSVLRSSISTVSFLLNLDNCKKVTIKNFVIDGNNKNPRAIRIKKSKVIELKNFTVKNLKLDNPAAIRVAGIEIDTENCRDISVHDFKIENCSTIDDGIIGNAQGTVRGVHLLSENNSLKDSKIRFFNFTISNLDGEDADAIHVQNCGEIDAVFSNFFIENCHARGIKIQNSSNAKFEKFDIKSEGEYLFRQAAISDYAAANYFRNGNIKIYSKYGIDIMSNSNIKSKLAIDNVNIEMLNAANVNGNNSYPISILQGDFILENVSIKNSTLITKNNYGIACLTYTKNLELLNIRNFSVENIMTGISLSVNYDQNNPYGSMYSHENLIIDNISDDSQGVYMSNDTTVSPGSSITNIKVKNTSSLSAVAGTRRHVIMPPDFLRGGAPAGDENYKVGQVLWNTNFTAHPTVAFWICVSKDASGIPTWKKIEMKDL